VSLAFIELYVQECNISECMRARDFVDQFVVGHTEVIGFDEDGSGAFVELLGSEEGNDGRPSWTGKPTHMLSYSWSYSMKMIVESLRTFETENPPTKGQTHFYFIDMFALNQHKFDQDCTEDNELQTNIIATLKESIRLPGRMICLLHPWTDPIPFRRVWCLFELHTALELGATIFMHLPPQDAEGFFSKLRKDGMATNSGLLLPTINASQAEASVESDRVRIFHDITQQKTMMEFNTELKQYLEQALRALATGAVRQKI
jgi:hypothetical protein